jgi:E3 ubiquitin-protein ligase RAD18
MTVYANDATQDAMLDDEPSDWPDASWQAVDAGLRCGICKEFFNAAMMLTGCSHNYCSLCIRQTFDAQPEVEKYCPTCRQPSGVRALVNNRALDDIVRNFTRVRWDFISISRVDCPR